MFSMLAATAVAVSAFFAALIGAHVFRHLALRLGFIDVPNTRSSHTLPTPRGGGIAIVGSSLGVVAGLYFAELLQVNVLCAFAIGGGAISTIGFIDDLHDLPPLIRLTVHLSAAGAAVIWLGGMPETPIGHIAIDLGWAEAMICVLATTWMLNLFNFMDGIDGLAAAEAIFVYGAGAGLIAFTGDSPGLALLLLGFAFSTLGFSMLNWAPAKLFMGDSGSGYLGYTIAVAAVASAHVTGVSLWTWMILCTPFIADASVTLVKRVWRRDRWYVAHRTHAYQWLQRRWQSHSMVVGAYSLVNIFLILPIAIASVLFPHFAAVLLLGSLLIACFVAEKCGAGRSEVAPLTA